jgi:hypothetical protein
MSTPSLLNIPYVIKAGTLYSQIPETGAGDFAVTRVTTPTPNRSTRINADGFIELVNDNVPRLDYPVGGAVNGCASLLVEPAATNSNSNSNTFSVETAPVATVVQNQVDPFGNPNSAWLMSGADSAADSASANNVRIIQSSLASNIYTCSIYIKSPTGSPVTFRYRQTAGGVISGSTVVSGSGFQRIQLTSPNTDTSSRFIIYTTGGEPIIISCHQVEAGTVATSYIPTTTQAITRAADVINKTSIASLIGQSEGTMYAEFDVAFNNRNTDIISLDSSGTQNGFFMTIRNSGLVQLIVRQNAANALIFQRTGAIPVGINKVAIAYKNGDFAISLNGTAAQVDTTSITMPSVAISRATIGLGQLYSLEQPVKIRSAAIYPNRLTNAQLQALTT